MPNNPAIEVAQAALDAAAVACRAAVLLTIGKITPDELDALTCAAACCRETSREFDERP